MRLKISAVVYAAAVVFALSGCDGPKSFTLTGKANLDGRPLPSGMVIVKIGDAEQRSGEIVRDGSFRVPECTAGTAKVAVRTSMYKSSATVNESSAKQGGSPIGYGQSSQPYVAIPEKYENLETSGLSFPVSASQSNLQIDLQSH